MSPQRRVNLKNAPWTMQEFFAGSGLVAYGLRGMFAPVWSNDIDERKADVYHANFQDDHFVLDDICNIRGNSIPPACLSWASFPCQDLSLAGTMEGIHAERSGLVWQWLRILQEMPERPPILVVENVLGLLSTNNGENYTQLHNALYSLGYNCGAMVINASHFVPQSRPRVFVLAVSQEISIPNELVDTGPNWLHNSVAASLGRILPGWIWWKAKRPPKRRLHLNDIIDYSLPYDKDEVLRLIPAKHQEKLDRSENVVATGYRRTRHGVQQLELRFDGVAGCLRTPEGGSSKQFLVVKRKGETHARLLSVREYARLMGAPESFLLPGNGNDGYKAMGDAVALPVAKFLGTEILTKLAEVLMDNNKVIQALKAFQAENKDKLVTQKGFLSVMLQLSNRFKSANFPLVPDKFLTASRGQVSRLSGPNCTKILKSHGITQELAAEAGRTSRGSISIMTNYCAFLNKLHDETDIDFSLVEDFWAKQIEEYFRTEPFTLKADTSKTIGANLSNLFEQVVKRQREKKGTQYMGTVLQQLVAAKLAVILPEESFEIHGASVADAPTRRSGDFVIKHTVIHCTTAPAKALIEKCRSNIDSGNVPVIITLFDSIPFANQLIKEASLDGRIEVWDIRQFLASNVYEHSLFDDTKRNAKMADIIKKYNEIIDAKEKDPSLRIEFDEP